MKYIVRYYSRFPIDPQDRYKIQREVVSADSKKEAGDIIAECGAAEIIGVDEYYEDYYIWKKQFAIRDAMVAAVAPQIENLLNGLEIIEKTDGTIDSESIRILEWVAPIEEGCGNDADLYDWARGG